MLVSEVQQKRINLPEILDRLYDNETAKVYIEAADAYLEKLGYTEHGLRHCRVVSSNAFKLLRTLGYPEELATLAAAAGYLHDIGNILGRTLHHEMGALLARDILLEVGFSLKETLRAMTAIVIHERDEGVVPDEVSAAVVIADKADVHRSRVRSPDSLSEDIHDRVNYAATQSSLLIEENTRKVVLSLTIDTRISPVIEYFEIFLTRMMACRKAAEVLKAEFNLYINNTRMA